LTEVKLLEESRLADFLIFFDLRQCRAGRGLAFSFHNRREGGNTTNKNKTLNHQYVLLSM
jgi:hypothetical protein